MSLKCHHLWGVYCHVFFFLKLTICSDLIFIPEPCDCVWCCLKRYICSSAPHTNLCSCPSCYTHQPCYQPNTQGASGLDGKPGSRVSQHLILLQHVLWLWICASGQTVLPHVLPSSDEGDIRLEWREKVYKDLVQKGNVAERSLQLWLPHSLNGRTSFWSPSASLENLLGVKNDQSN